MKINNNKIQFKDYFYAEDELLEMALKHHKAGDLQTAESIYRKIYINNPRNADALHLSALILYHFGMLSTAISTIKRAISLKSDSPQYYYNLGIFYLEANDNKQTKECFRKALELKPEYVKAKKAING